jgi:hypothetical protein
MATNPKKIVDPTEAALSAIQEALKVRDDGATAGDQGGFLRDPTLDERVSVYLRAINGTGDFGPKEYSEARNDILDAMAADVAVKLGRAPQQNREPRGLPDTPGMQAEGPPFLMGASFQASIKDPSPDVDFVMAAQARQHFAVSAARPAPAAIRPVDMAAPSGIRHIHKADKEDFAAAAPHITPTRRPPFKFSLRTIGTLGIMVCAAAVIAGAGTFLFSRNDETSLAWFFDQPKQSAKTEVAIQSSATKARSLMPATVEPRLVMSEIPGQQPSPEEPAELVDRVRLSMPQFQAVASWPPIQRNGLIGAGTASLLPSLAASQAVASGSPTLAAALAWYQNPH